MSWICDKCGATHADNELDCCICFDEGLEGGEKDGFGFDVRDQFYTHTFYPHPVSFGDIAITKPLTAEEVGNQDGGEKDGF